MIVYWLGCALSALLAHLCHSAPRAQRNRTLAVFFSALPLLLISALRYDVGYDYLPTYVSYFELVKKGMVGSQDRLEWLWHLINQVLAWMNADAMWIFAVAALVFFMCVYAEIFRASPYPALSVFLLTGMGYLFVSFNAVRQMVGCGILLFSVRYIEARKPWKFLFCVLLAGGFHNSCYVFLVAYWLSKVRIKPVVAFLMTAAVVALRSPVTSLVRYIISRSGYQVYLASVFDTGETAYVFLAINFVLLVFASVLYRDEPRYRIYYFFQILALWITIYSGRVVLILRMMWAFGLPSIILVPMSVEKLEEPKDRALVMAVMILLFFLYTLYTVGLQNSNSVLPYQTIFTRWLS